MDEPDIVEKVVYNWDRFVEFCEQEGILLEHEEDWHPWWKCWVASLDADKEQ